MTTKESNGNQGHSIVIGERISKKLFHVFYPRVRPFCTELGYSHPTGHPDSRIEYNKHHSISLIYCGKCKHILFKNGKRIKQYHSDIEGVIGGKPPKLILVDNKGNEIR